MSDNQSLIRVGVEGAQAAAAQLDALAKRFDGFQSRISALGNLSIMGLGGQQVLSYFKQLVDAADQMNDLSQSTGIAIKQLATWQLAADQSGASIETVARGVKGLSAYIMDHGDKLRAAGITATDANGAMIQLADLFKAMPDGVEKTTLAVTLFGKAGMDLIPMLNLGSAGLAEAQAKAAEYARRLDALAPKADVFNDNLAELALQSKVAGMNLTTYFLPGLIGVTQWLNDLAVGGDKAHEALEWLMKESAFSSPVSRGAFDAGKWIIDAQTSLDGVDGTERARRLAWANRQTKPAETSGSKRTAEEKEALRRAERLRIATEADAKAKAAAQAMQRMLAKGQQNELDAYYATGGEETMREVGEQRAKQEAMRISELTERYKAIADPLQKYRDQLAEINQLRQSGSLSSEEAIQAEIKVQAGLDETRRAMVGLKDDGKDAFADLTRAVEGWGNAFTDSMADMVMTGKLSFGSLAESIIRDLLRMQIQANITKPLLGAAGSFLDGLFGNNYGATDIGDGGWGRGASSITIAGSPMASAKGNVFSSPDLARYANTIVSSPTLFKFANGGAFRSGLMGEAGPEAIMPLTRMGNGKLGVQAAGGGSNVQVIVNNNGSNTRATTRESTDSRGQRRIEVVIADMVSGELSRPGSGINNTMRSSFGAQPALVGR